MRVRPQLVVLLAIVCGLFVWHAQLYRGWVEDDAFIAFRYAENFNRGLGLVFNPGDRLEGYSNLAWVLMSALALRVGSDPVLAAQVLGVLSGLVCLVVSWRLACLLQPEHRAGALLAPLFLAVSPVLTRHAVSGLETVGYAAVLAVVVLLVLEPNRTRFGQMVFVPLLLLLVVLRPEGVAMAAIALVWDRRRRGSGWRTIAVVAVFVLGLLGLRGWYYGSLLPNTYYFKLTGGSAGISPGIHYTLDFMRENGGAAVVGAGFALLLVPAARRGLVLFVAVGVVHGAVIVAAGGDWMHHYRFWAPVLPLIAAVLAAGSSLVAARICQSRGGYRLGWVIVGATLAAATINIYKTERVVWRDVMPAVATGQYYAQSYERVGRWLEANTAHDAVVAVGDVGAIGYFSGRRILDTLGLLDRHIARTPGALHLKHDASYVLQSEPDYVVLIVGPDEHCQEEYRRLADRLLAEHPGFAAGYEPVHTIVLGYRDEQARIHRRVPGAGNPAGARPPSER